MNGDTQTGPWADDDDTLKAATALHEQGRLDEALDAYRRILEADGDHPMALNYAAVILFERGNRAEAIRLAERAVAARPDFVDGQNNLGLMLQREGRAEEALAAYRRLAALIPEAPEPHLNIANVLVLLGRHAAAEEEYDRVISIDPGQHLAYGGLAKALLELGRWPEALAACDACLEAAPGHTGAMALKSVALGALGDAAGLRRLVDFERLIRPQRVDPPSGFDDLEAFNRALARHSLAHPTLTYEPPDNTTMKGHQSGDLMVGDKGPVAALETLIVDAVERYQEAVSADADHPFLAQGPTDVWINAWATILSDGGHQAVHIHRSGWLSGVYYVQVPDVIGPGEGKEGWIEFGRPPPYPGDPSTPDVRLFQPEEGLMVLFPSYFYHRTVPFRSDAKRISIAFDIIPGER